MTAELLRSARDLIEQGNFDQALLTLRKLEADNPQSPEINQLLGHIAYRSGDSDEAIKRLSKAQEIFDHQGNFIPAIGCLEELLKIEVTPDKILQLASFYDRIGLKNEAFLRLYKMAEDCIRMGDDESALKMISKICDIDFNNLKIRLIYGKMLVYSDRRETGFEYLSNLRNDAVAKGQNDIVTEIDTLLAEHDGGEELDPKSRIELANLLSEIGSAEEAVVEYFAAVADLIEMNQQDEARKVLNRILELDPENSKAVEELEKLGPEESKELAETADKSEETQVVTEQPELIESAETELNAVAEDKPGEDLPTIESLEGQVADIEFLLKEVEAKPKVEIRLTDLLTEFKSAMRAFPEDSSIRLQVGEVLTKLLLFDLAIENYKRLLDVPEFRSRTIEKLGITYIRAGKFNEGLRYLAEAIVARPDNIDIRYNLALAYQGMGDHNNALKQLSLVLEVDPQFRDAQELYKVLGGEEKAKPVVREEVGDFIQGPSPQRYPEERSSDENIVFI